jgi:hypothetical protein
MSTISVTNITTANGSTPLTLTTGNTSAGDIVIDSSGGVIIAANSTVNSIIISTGSLPNTLVTNSTGLHISSNLAVSGVITGNLTVIDNITANNFSGFGIGFGSNLQILESGTSWSIPTGVKRWKVTVVGGGGQGGGSAATAGHVGNGGGSGASVVGFYNFVSGLTTMAYNIGAAGSGAGTNTQGTAGGASNTTYNSIVFNAGGGGGGNTSATIGGGGLAGTGTGGTWNFTGDKGFSGGVAAATNPVQGAGGHTRFGLGVGGGHVGTAAGATGEVAEGYGAGGGGGKSGSAATARAGGAGVQGIIIVEW